MGTQRRALLNLVFVAVVFLALFGTVAPPASAHPLGNFTTNRFSGLEITANDVRIHYVVDFAELAAFEEKEAMDVDGDGVNPNERERYAEDMAKRLLNGFFLRIDDSDLDPRPTDSLASFQPGQGGLETLRVEVDFVADLPDTTGTLGYVDYNYSSRLGWKEVVARAHGGIRIVESSVPERSISNELREYPRDRLDDPLEVSTVRVTIEPGEDSGSEPDPVATEDDRSGDVLGEAFTSLIEPGTSTPFLVAVALAMVFGAAHALGPGHGKLLLAAYLTGTDAKARHAVRVGVAVSLMHTLSVVVVGLLILWGTSLFRPEDIYPWLGALSGAIVFGLGAVMTAHRIADHRHGAKDGGEHHHHHGPSHDHSDAAPSTLGLGAIALGGGLLPSPSAIVVLLGAVSLNRIAAGVILVLAFGVGLALMLTGLGLLVLKAKAVAARGVKRSSFIPILSSLAVTVLGAFLTIRALLTL